MDGEGISPSQVGTHHSSDAGQRLKDGGMLQRGCRRHTLLLGRWPKANDSECYRHATKRRNMQI